MEYKLLARFRDLFQGEPYRHRISTLGDSVAGFLYDDLYALGRSKKFLAGVDARTHAVNKGNKRVGKKARRGDGTFGEAVPGTLVVVALGSPIGLGEIATIEIGVESKILAKAMIKQLDRVGTDMENQVREFKRHGGHPICVGLIGINYAAQYTSYEGERSYTTDGSKDKHPIQEAAQAERRLLERVVPLFDEAIVLRFRCSNVPPYADFEWLNEGDTEKNYGAALIRISREYDARY